MFNCVRSSILANSVEIFADVHICFVADNFYFLIFEKTKQQNRRIELTKTSFRDVSLSRNGTGRDAGHFFPFRDCPGQFGTSGHPRLYCLLDFILSTNEVHFQRYQLSVAGNNQCPSPVSSFQSLTAKSRIQCAAECNFFSTIPWLQLLHF